MTRCFCSEPPEHDADHCEANECYDGCGVAFKVTSQAAVAADPRKSSFDDPALGENLEAGSIGTLHDAQPPCPRAPDVYLLASLCKPRASWVESKLPVQVPSPTAPLFQSAGNSEQLPDGAE